MQGNESDRAAHEAEGRGLFGDHGLPDSGDRTPQYGGAMRDRAPGKGRFDLLNPFFLQALAVLAEQGAAKYAHRNWERGYSTALCADSADRHLKKFLMGDATEDHLVAVAWNAMAAWSIIRTVREGHLPERLIDHLPYYVVNPFTGRLNVPPCDAEDPDSGARCNLDSGHGGLYHQYEDDEGRGVGWPVDGRDADSAGVPLADEPPGMWERADYEGGPPDEVRGTTTLHVAAAYHDKERAAQASAVLNAVETIKQTGGSVEIAGVKITLCDGRGRTEAACKHCGDRLYHVRGVWHDHGEDPALCHASPGGGHEPLDEDEPFVEVCARCGGYQEEHGPEGPRAGCSFAGEGTRSRCGLCGCEIRWTGSRWKDNHPGEPWACPQSTRPDVAHEPVDGGDLRG